MATLIRAPALNVAAPNRPLLEPAASRSHTPMTPARGQLPQLGTFELQQLEKSPSPMCIFDRETLWCLAANDAALRLFGYERDEFMNLTLTDTRHPDEDHRFDQGIGSALPRHCGLRRHIKRSGEMFFADVVVQDVLHDMRHARLIVLLDRMERASAPPPAVDSENIFSTLVEHSPDVIARIDRQLRHIYVNPAVSDALGIAPEGLIGKSARELNLPPELCVRWAAGARRVFATGRQQELDVSFAAPEGERHFAAHMVPELGAHGQVESVLAIARDISQAKRAELALRASESKLRQSQKEFETLADALPQVVTCYDRQLRHTYANAAIERMTGKIPSEVLGRTDLELAFPSDLTAQWTYSLRKVLETGKSSIVELDYPGAQGSRRYEMHYIPLTQKGTVEGVICVANDVTARTRAAEDRLSLMSQQGNTLLREVHHRVKNNLQGVVGLLRQMARADSDLAPLLDKAVAQLQTMSIVHGLQEREWRDRVALDGLVAEIAKSVEQATGVAVTYTLDSRDNAQPHAREQDAVAVALVTHELVLNACRHGTGGLGKTTVKVRLVSGGESARIAVTNRGSLPLEFNFARDAGLGTGLDLVKALLPVQGASVAYAVDPWEVTATLTLEPPVLAAPQAAGDIS